MEVEHVMGATRALEQIEDLLLTDEARHNLALGILSTAQDHPDLYPEVDGWVVRDGPRVVGAAIRTPPHNLVVARPVDEHALAALAGAIDTELPGVIAAVPEVDAFAAVWAERHQLDVALRFEQGIYALRTVESPGSAPGRMRLASAADRQPLLESIRAFAAEVFPGDPHNRAHAERGVDTKLAGRESGFALWEVNGRSVSLAGFGSPTPTGIRIGPVYTPPEHRGRGFGTAVTAAVSQLALDRGSRFCFLYTDLANPTSNSIYMRIGYQRVCDSRELAFVRR